MYFDIRKKIDGGSSEDEMLTVLKSKKYGIRVIRTYIIEKTYPKLQENTSQTGKLRKTAKTGKLFLSHCRTVF